MRMGVARIELAADHHQGESHVMTAKLESVQIGRIAPFGALRSVTDRSAGQRCVRP
jgi:hypothetical protein